MDIDYLLVILSGIIFIGVFGLILVIWQYGNSPKKENKPRGAPVDTKKKASTTAFHRFNTERQETLVSELTPDIPLTHEDANLKNEEKQRLNPKETLIILQLLATEERPYKGYELIQTLSSAGFHYGEMNIFHYHANQNGKKQRLFSLASALEPGTFDLTHIGEIHCPGLCLFMSIPKRFQDVVRRTRTNARNVLDSHEHVSTDVQQHHILKDEGYINKTIRALDTFELMLETAQLLIQDLGGTLCDQQRALLTTDALTHYRSQLYAYA
ncbi:MAG: cell division protein ZipA C-terminal FtsZ-binding domain-containing protein [Pseudomonadota bacterium]